MSAEDFFSRWEKKNKDAQEAKAIEPAPPPAPDPYEGRVPTQEDLDQLTPQADFAPFMKQGVDEGVKRSALKKLFSDPHFNIMDGLDIYIGDYTKSDPIPPEMMAMLEHAKGLLNPDLLLNKPVMALKSDTDLPLPQAENEQAPLAAQDEQDASLALQESDQHTPDDTANAQPAESAGVPAKSDQQQTEQQATAPAEAGNTTSGTKPDTETGTP